MNFSRLADYFSKLENTASRNEKTVILARLFKEARPDEIDKICYLALGRLGPRHLGIEFNLAEKLMIRILGRAYHQKESQVGKVYGRLGDLGSIAFELDKKAAGQSLTVDQVFNSLLRIAQDHGQGSVERKVSGLVAVLKKLDGQSAKYIVRITLGKLRLGFSDQTILDSLSWFLAGNKNLKPKIEAAYNVRADVGFIAQVAKLDGLAGLGEVGISLGTPVVLALCQRLPDAGEMIKHMCRPGSKDRVAVEPKWDGTRLEIHFSRQKQEKSVRDQGLFSEETKGFVRIFTRNLENVAGMFPDLALASFEELKAQEVILDGEAIGYDPGSGKLLPFQETIKRKRKHAIKQTIRKIPMRYFCFDVLYKDGQNLLKAPFAQRRKILESIVEGKNRTFLLAPQIITNDPVDLKSFHQQQLKAGLEGAVVKKWQAAYDPGRRGYTWVKFKQEKGKKGGGLADTIDGVVMGFYRGRGKRADFGIGMILVGICQKISSGLITSLTKVGTGPSDEQWQEMRRRGEKAAVKEKPINYQVDKNLWPDVWCAPEILVEIEADNITKSPIHTSGYALRFPRWLRFRDDKSVSQVTTLAEIKKLYRLQK
ncbi:MAG: ATP-dependent DNA ligase [Candidatus Pacebacteria bacterium]|nr:ATP-dependent DNA ligase [Candidatus Paceibacterota bacterium]